jgi:hypothetical protein
MSRAWRQPRPRCFLNRRSSASAFRACCAGHGSHLPTVGIPPPGGKFTIAAKQILEAAGTERLYKNSVSTLSLNP